MKKLLLTSLAVPAIMLGMATSAGAQEVEVSVSVDAVSEYVFRGVTLAGAAVQPGIEAAFGDFTVGAWASVPAQDANSWDTELDLYAGYSFAVSEDVALDVGATLYHYPEANGGLLDIGTDLGDASTLEFYASVGFGGMFEPSVTAYYDISFEALTLEGSAGYSIPLSSEQLSLDLGLTVGSVSFDGPGDWQYGQASAALSYAVSDAVSAYVGANVGVSSEDTFSKVSALASKSSSAWVGAGISTGF